MDIYPGTICPGGNCYFSVSTAMLKNSCTIRAGKSAEAFREQKLVIFLFLSLFYTNSIYTTNWRVRGGLIVKKRENFGHFQNRLDPPPSPIGNFILFFNFRLIWKMLTPSIGLNWDIFEFQTCLTMSKPPGSKSEQRY